MSSAAFGTTKSQRRGNMSQYLRAALVVRVEVEVGAHVIVADLAGLVSSIEWNRLEQLDCLVDAILLALKWAR